jgi:phospholipase/carboxylesterase
MAPVLAQAGARPRDARMGLVLIHGRGATAEGILDLGHALGLPDVALVAPQAPGMSWWPTSFLAPMAQMEPFVERGLATVDAAVSALVDEGLAPERIALAGFSQGGCLALEYAARRGGLSAVFGLSAGLVGTGDAGDAASDALYGFGSKTFDYGTRLDGVPVEISSWLSPAARNASRSASTISAGVFVSFHAKSSIARCRAGSSATR